MTALLAELLSRHEWTEEASCAQIDPEMWFPEKGGTSAPAKQICRTCPVRVECLDEALKHDDLFGIWGGLSVTERRRLRDRSKAVAA